MAEKPRHPQPNPEQRATYRHGDLRRALIEAGVELARAGGPDAVVLREATRRAGVVPNAAYRHFANREALLQAVRAAALSAVALSMEKEITSGAARAKKQDGKSVKSIDAVEAARASVRAVGRAYMRFARAETGLFRTAFAAPVDISGIPNEAKSGPGGMNPFELLGAALDQMVDAGLMTAQQRRGAEFLAWSAVHGMAIFLIDGPLRQLTRKQADEFGQRLLDMVEKGIA